MISANQQDDWSYVFKLKPKVKKLWLDALRNGEYKQTRRQLHNSEGFCCLGVLSDVLMKNGLVSEPLVWTQSPNRIEGVMRLVNQKDPCGSSSDTLPIEPVIKAAFIEPDAILGRGNNLIAWRISRKCSLFNMNDEGSTFLEIAAVIEERM